MIPSSGNLDGACADADADADSDADDTALAVDDGELEKTADAVGVAPSPSGLRRDPANGVRDAPQTARATAAMPTRRRNRTRDSTRSTRSSGTRGRGSAAI
jgi:hypothetical protein